MSEIKHIGSKALQKAYDGSYYLIAGTGGDLQKWVEGYEALLAENEIGKPVAWLQTKGVDINEFADSGKYVIKPRERFPADLTVLLFPMDGLNIGRLAMLKLQMEDRWFDDVVHNMRSKA